MATEDGLGFPMASLGFGLPPTYNDSRSSGLYSNNSPLTSHAADSLLTLSPSMIKEERGLESRSSCQNGNLGPASTSGSLYSSQNCRTPLQESLNYNTSASPRKKLAIDTSVAYNSLTTIGNFDLYSPKGREDHSPNNNSSSGVLDSFKDSRRNRGTMSRQQEELCLVCGDRASGYHYNALTCEGCKGFFRRSITKNAVYQCKYGNNCEIDMYMRRKCQECRLKKCLKVGMRPECVVPEYQCAVKREAKRAQKDKDKPNSTTKDSAGSPEVQNGVQSNSLPRPSPDDDELTLEEEELIERIVFFQEEFESPSSEDLAKIAALDEIEVEDGEKQFKHITEITIFTIRLIVEFAKRVPWFDTLLREDQITLLKACSSEVMTLRSTRRYDVNTDCIVFANDQPYTRDNYRSAGLNDLPDPVFDFARKMCLMKTDNAEYALLTCIILFSDRPNLLEPQKVEAIQDIYLGALRKYVNGRRPKNSCMLARLLTTLTELRTLGSLNSEVCFSLKLQNKHLPAFLAEIWDVNS